jgi:hypothetical protein
MASPSIDYAMTNIEELQTGSSTMVAPLRESATAASNFIGLQGGEGFDTNSAVTGLYGGRLPLATSSSDFSTRQYIYFQLASQQYNVFGNINTLANGGLRFLVVDGSGNWVRYNIGGSDLFSITLSSFGGYKTYEPIGGANALNGQAFVIDRNATPDASSGTIDWTDINDVELHADVASSDQVDVYMGRLKTCDPPIVTDGDVSTPIDLDFISDKRGSLPDNGDSGRWFAYNRIDQAGGLGRTYAVQYGFTIGDGSTLTRWDQSVSQIAFYPSRAAQLIDEVGIEGYMAAFVGDGTAGHGRLVTINQSASDYVRFQSGFIFSGVSRSSGGEYDIEVTGSTSGTCLFDTNQFYNANSVKLAHATATDCVFDRAWRVEITSDTTITGAIIRNNESDADGLVITSGAGDYSAINAIFSNNSGNDITLGSGGAGSYDLSGLSSSGTIKVHNDSVNNITITVAQGTVISTTTDGGTITVLQAGIVTVTDGATYTEDAADKFVVDTDTVTSFTISGFEPTEVEHIGSGTSTVLGVNNAKLNNTTITATGGTIVKGDGLNPSTNWVESGTTDKVVTLTTSTTETDLLGLRGLEFVDYIETGDFKTYTFAEDVRLKIDGDLQIDPSKEKIVLSAIAKNNTTLTPLRVASGGILRLGVFQNVNGVDTYSQGSGIEFIGSSNDFFSYFMMYVSSGGTFIWNGGTIRTFGTLRIEGGSTLTINDGTLLSLSSTQEVQLRLTPTSVGGGSNLNINNMVFDGLVLQSRFFTTYGFNNAAFIFKKGEFQTYNGVHPEQTLIDLDNSENTNTSDVTSAQNDSHRSEDIYIQNAFKQVSFSAESSRNLYAHVLRQIDITPEDLNGVSLSEFSYYGKDINNGLRQVGPMNATDSSQDDTLDKEYTGINQSTPINDNLLLMLAILIEGGTGNIVLDDRTNSETIPLNIIAYDRSITQWNTALYGLGTLTESLPMTPDLSIIETNKATVDAYTELETPQKLYDRAKSELVAAYLGESEPTVGREGNIIDCKTLDIAVNFSGATVYDLTGTTLTITASTFTGGFKDGTLSNGTGNTIFNDLVLQNMTWNAEQATWTGSADATTTIDVANGGTYDATGFTFDAASTLNNSSGGSIDVVLDAGQQQPLTTGDTVNFVIAGVTVTINNLTSANVQFLENDNTTVQGRQTSQTGTVIYNVPNGSTGTWSYCINRAGYAPIIGTFSATGSDVTVDATQSQKLLPDGSAAYTASTSAFLSVVPQADGSRMNLRIGDGEAPVRSCFDEVEDALQTQDGMSYLMNGGGEVSYVTLPTGAYLFYETAVRHIRDNAGDDGATIAAFVQSTDGTPLDNSNGDVKYFTVSAAQVLSEYQYQIWIDPVNGTNASVYPYGTQSNPVNSWSNAKILADNYGFRDIRIRGTVTLDADLQGFIVKGGNITDTLLTAGYDLTGSTFSEMNMGGASTGIHACETVNLLDGTTGLNGSYVTCGFAGAMTLEDGASVLLSRCVSNIAGLTAPQITHGTNTQLSVRSYNGGLLLSGSTAGCNTTLEYNAGKANLDVSNTGGVISVRGIPKTAITDNSAGATIDLDASFENEVMRGTDGANTTAPDNASIAGILADTSELQTNQGNWITATGFSTPTNVTDAQASIIAEVNANEGKIDALETKTQADARQALLLAEHDVTQAQITALNDFNPAVDAVANVTLVDTTTTNTDMVSEPDNAGITANGLATSSLNNISLADIEATAILAKKADLTIINQGVQKSSKLIPHSTDLT